MTTVDAPELLTVAEAAKYLRVSIDTIRRWCRSGELPCKNLGDRAGYRIKREDILAFLDRRPAKDA
jgi:excisionase family DNA binding protein